MVDFRIANTPSRSAVRMRHSKVSNVGAKWWSGAVHCATVENEHQLSYRYLQSEDGQCRAKEKGDMRHTPSSLQRRVEREREKEKGCERDLTDWGRQSCTNVCCLAHGPRSEVATLATTVVPTPS